MPITGPELGDGIALSIGIDLAMIFQTRWKASYLWPGPPTPSSADSTDSLDGLADEKQAVATADVLSTAASDRQSRGGAGEAAPQVQQQLLHVLDSPLLPTAAFAGTTAACSQRSSCSEYRSSLSPSSCACSTRSARIAAPASVAASWGCEPVRHFGRPHRRHTRPAGAAAVCLGAAASAGGWLLRWAAGYAAAELGFQSFQCWR